MRYEKMGQIELPASNTARRVKTFALMSADILSALIAVCLSFAFTNLTRHVLGIQPITLSDTGTTFHIALVSTFTISLFIWFRTKGHYRRRQALADQLGAVIGGSAIAMLCAVATQFVTIEVGSRLLTLSYWLILVPFLIVGRALTRRALRAFNAWASPAVLFTDVGRQQELATFVKRRAEIGAQIVSVMTVTEVKPSDLVETIVQVHRDGAIAIYAPTNGDPAYSEVVQSLVLLGIPFILSPQLGPVPNHAEILEFPPEDIALIDIRDPINRPFANLTKRAFDLVLASVALLSLLPLLATIALIIRTDGGPALFRQKRVGRNGKIFYCLKFRSMVLNAEDKLQRMIETDPAIAAEWKAYQKLKRDPRITFIGRFIRKANIDELPQIINVLRGDMSIVGPRPMIEPQIVEYGPAFEAYKRVRPGITGMWQVNGRNATTFTERARLDAWYVRNWSLWRDFVILVRTIREVIFARGN